MGFDGDASKYISYPRTQTVLYDISGNRRAINLNNGVGFDTTTKTLTFDGTNDYGLGTLAAIPSAPFALEIVGKFDQTTRNPYEYFGAIGIGGTYRMMSISKVGTQYPNASYHGNLYTYLGTTNASITDIPLTGVGYYHIVMQALDQPPWVRAWVNESEATFVDGEIPAQEVIPNSSNLYLSAWSGGTWYLDGNIASCKVYNKELTDAERKQNYFGSNIVTDGLIFAVDANNIVSYSKSGTTAYNLAGSNTLTLVNGLGYNQGNGGYFDVDGTNDALTTPDSSNLDLANEFTIEGWVWWNQHKNYGSLLVKGPGGSGQLFNYSFFFYASQIAFGYGDGVSFYATYINNSLLPTNQWHHIMGTFDGGELKFYLNGKLRSTTAGGGPPNQNNDALNVIQTQYPIDGRIANARVYNRALSAQEVLQNYQAEQYRFETPEGVVTNGLLLLLDASDPNSYPGSGADWYDLSGNNFHMKLYNSPSYVNNGGFGYFDLDGVDDYGSCDGTVAGSVAATVANLGIGLDASKTVVCIAQIKYGVGSINQGLFDLGDYGAIGRQYCLRLRNSSYTLFRAQFFSTPDYDFTYNSLNRFSFFNVAYDQGTQIGQTFGNYDTLLGQDASPFSLLLDGARPFEMARYAGGNYSGAKIAFFAVYDHQLTSEEMIQNYNYIKNKYGIETLT